MLDPSIVLTWRTYLQVIGTVNYWLRDGAPRSVTAVEINALDHPPNASVLDSAHFRSIMHRDERLNHGCSRSLGLWIGGLGTQYPPHLLEPEKLDALVNRFYDIDFPGIKKLLKLNRTTGIETRSAIINYETGWGTDKKPPSIADLDTLFRTAGVANTVQACQKAIKEWNGKPCDITHTVAVTCTNQGNPGFDHLVNEQLGLPSSIDRTLLQGVGCAGGLAIMRIAAQLACGATMRGRPARILCFACELCTPNVRYELDAAAKCLDPSQVCVAGALFSDAAAAFVLCNELGLDKGSRPVYELLGWDNMLIPGTSGDIGSFAEATGYRTILSRAIPKYAVAAVEQITSSLLPSIRYQSYGDLDVANSDWALHPGGQAIIGGVQQAMGLEDEQLRATREIYKTRGNSSSPSVLAVLDKLRYMNDRKRFVIATAFGPGLSVEMSVLRPCFDLTA